MATTMTMDELLEATDVDLGASEWVDVTQEMIDQFADATGDHQWIHVDAEQAAQGPFGGTIAHGFLTISLLPMLLGDMLDVPGSAMGVNYGMNRLRLTAPVPSGSRVRATGRITGTEEKAGGVLVTIDTSVEIEGGDRPAAVGEFLALRLG